MLLESPHAFGSSPDDDRWRDLEAMKSTFEHPDHAIMAIASASANSELIASSGVMREPRAKRRHIATIWGVYVAPGARGLGLGRAVVEASINVARTWDGLDLIELGVSEGDAAPDQSPAKKLYESLGFIEWGHEPNALRINGRSYSHSHMYLPIR